MLFMILVMVPFLIKMSSDLRRVTLKSDKTEHEM